MNGIMYFPASRGGGVTIDSGPNWRGLWGSASAYSVGDAVSYLGSSYVATANNTNDAPPSVNWTLIAAAGADGDPGATGADGAQGPQGDPGATGATGAMGPQGDPGLVWLGPWDSATAYVVNDAVSYGGSAYVAVAPSTNSQPPSADWQLLASKGDTGATGADGAQGPQGDPGATGATGATGSDGSNGLNASRNRILNGSFLVQQRGSVAKSVATTNTYYLDCWASRFDGSAVSIDVSPQSFSPGQIDVPGNPKYFARLDCPIGPASQTFNQYTQRIEGVEKLAGQQVTLSFYAKASAAATLGCFLRQNFGSGGSSSVDSSNQNNSLTTSWQRFTYTVTLASISGKTIGSSDYLEVIFSLPLNAAFTIDIANVQLEPGSTATEFEYRSYGAELALCQRYFERLSAAQNGMLAIATMNTATLMVAAVQVSRKRVKPTATGSAASSFSFAYSGSGFAGSSLTFFNVNNTSTIVEMGLTLGSSLTVGVAGLLAGGTGGCFIDASAEL